MSHEKEQIWLSPNEVDEPGASILTEVSQKEKDKYHVSVHINGIQRDGANGLQSSSGDGNTDNRLAAEGEGGPDRSIVASIFKWSLRVLDKEKAPLSFKKKKQKQALFFRANLGLCKIEEKVQRFPQ